MRRYLRLYLAFAGFAFSKSMEFRLDFFFRIGMDVLWNVVNVIFFWVLLQHTPVLGGWTFDQMLVFAGAVFVVDGIHMTILSNNIWMMPILVNRGDMDYYLARPVSSLFFVSFRDFAANSFFNFLIASGILGWALWRYPLHLGAGSILLFLFLLMVGEALHYALSILFLIPCFWSQSSGGMRDIFWATEQYMTRPYGIFEGWMARILISILPFALIVSFPVRILFEGPSARLLVHMFGVTAIVFALLGIAWRSALRAYSSASS